MTKRWSSTSLENVLEEIDQQIMTAYEKEDIQFLTWLVGERKRVLIEGPIYPPSKSTVPVSQSSTNSKDELLPSTPIIISSSPFPSPSPTDLMKQRWSSRPIESTAASTTVPSVPTVQSVSTASRHVPVPAPAPVPVPAPAPAAVARPPAIVSPSPAPPVPSVRRRQYVRMTTGGRAQYSAQRKTTLTQQQEEKYLKRKKR
jgi:hypothetical protein